jgi:Sortase domain
LTRLREHPVRVVLRFVASVMMVSGVLLITDAVVTLAWQEPVSAYLAERQQVKLEKALIDPPERVVRKEPLPGDALGKLLIPSIGVSEYVVEGTDAENLRKGPGHYPETPLPGQRGTVAIAGHRTTFGAPFRKLDQLKKGDRIVVEPAGADRLPPALLGGAASRGIRETRGSPPGEGAQDLGELVAQAAALDLRRVLRLEPHHEDHQQHE